MIRVLAFDLDDTLYEERQFVIGGIRAMAEHVADRCGINEAQARWMLQSIHDKMGRKAMLDEFAKLFELPSEIRQELVQAYRNHQPKLKMFQGYGEILAQLKDSYRLALLTDGLPEVQERKVHALGLDSIMEPIIYTWSEGKMFGKPSQCPYQRLLRDRNGDLRDVLYVGDNPEKDFIGAKTLGIQTLRVLTGPHRFAWVQPAFNADFTIPSLHQLPSFLKLQKGRDLEVVEYAVAL